MIHHPVIVVPKLVLLAIIIVVLIILHGSLSPSDFRVAVIVAAVFFLCSVVAVWIIALKVFSNPKSRIARATILSHEERSEDGFRAFSDESASLVGGSRRYSYPTQTIRHSLYSGEEDLGRDRGRIHTSGLYGRGPSYSECTGCSPRGQGIH